MLSGEGCNNRSIHENYEYFLPIMSMYNSRYVCRYTRKLIYEIDSHLLLL